MNVNIRIKYLSPAGRAQQGGSFPLRGRKPEQIAFEWLKQIKREVNFEELIEVIVDENIDITETILEMEKAPLD